MEEKNTNSGGKKWAEEQRQRESGRAIELEGETWKGKV